MAEEVTLDFIGARLVHLVNELREVRGELAAMRSDMSEIRDDVRVLTAMAVRQDNRAMRTLDLLHSTIERVRALEDTP